MNEPLSLSHGPWRCEIVPALGGCVAGLWLGDLPVLRSTSAGELDTVRQAGSYPLVPFSNRIAQGTLEWEGTSHPLIRYVAAEPHAIHGVGWQRPWQVLERSESRALLAYEHRPDAAWPFAFDASQGFRLGTEGLEMTLSLTNQSGRAAPAGLGWHPFFVKRARSHIALQASGRWDMGPDKLPTERRPSVGLDADCGSLDVDHCFDGWTGVAHLEDECLRMQVLSRLSRLVVFTNPTRDIVAIEPVSHVNNAMNRVAAGARAEDLGLTVLRPGETLSAVMEIRAERVA